MLFTMFEFEFLILFQYNNYFQKIDYLKHLKKNHSSKNICYNKVITYYLSGKLC